MATMRLVRMVCAKALHQDGATRVLVELCLTVIKKQRSSSDFAEHLLESFTQRFIRHEELLPRFVRKGGEVAYGGKEPCYRWTLFVAFLAELLVGSAGCGSARLHACPLAVLLCECCEIMLRCPAPQDALDKMKVLPSALVVAGAAAEFVAAEAVKDLVASIGRASVGLVFPTEAQEVILELIHQHGGPKRPGINTTYIHQGRMHGKR